MDYCNSSSRDSYLSLRSAVVVSLALCGGLRPLEVRFLRDSDIDIETVSVLMGHCTTATTNKYYARMKETKAVEHVKAMWSNTVPCVRKLTVVRTPTENKPDNKGEYETGAQEGIRTPGLQLRRLPPYPD